MTTQNISLQEYNFVEARLAELTSQYAGALYEVGTSEGMSVAKAARRELRTMRTDLEKVRKQIKQPVLDRGKLIDAEAKRITAILQGLETPIDDQIKAEERRKAEEKAAAERAENERVAGIKARIAEFDDALRAAVGVPADRMAELLEQVKSVDIDESFAEFQERAMVARANAVERLAAAVVEARNLEAEQKKLREEQAELARQKAAQEADAQKEREALEAQRREQEDRERRTREAEAELQRKLADEDALVRLADAQAKAEADRRAALAEARVESAEAALAAIYGIVAPDITSPADSVERIEAVRLICEANLEDSSRHAPMDEGRS